MVCCFLLETGCFILRGKGGGARQVKGNKKKDHETVHRCSSHTSRSKNIAGNEAGGKQLPWHHEDGGKWDEEGEEEGGDDGYVGKGEEREREVGQGE